VDPSFTHYYWDASTNAGKMVGKSYTITNAVKSSFNATYLAQAKTELLTAPVGSTASYPVIDITHVHESTPSFVPHTTITFDDPGLFNSIDDEFGAIGRGRLDSNRASFTVKRIEIDQYVGDDITGGPIFHKVPALEVSARTVGTVEDLYDFNYNAGGASEIGSTLQLGYGNGSYGRTGGQIYQSQIDFDVTNTWVIQ